MAAQVLADLAAEVTRIKGTIDSAVALINGIAARVQAAVDAAIANGATAAELAPVTDLVSTLKSEDDNLAAAVAANA